MLIVSKAFLDMVPKDSDIADFLNITMKDVIRMFIM